MGLKSPLVAIVCTALSAWAGLATAEQYRPGEFLGLDLSKAVLSPKPLGPPAGFTPGPLDEHIDRGERPQAQDDPKAEPDIAVRKTAAVHPLPKQSRGAIRTRLARHRGNPLDAQAFDTRIQVWPCRTGGICQWKRPGN
jgi:hypothetical protein